MIIAQKRRNKKMGGKKTISDIYAGGNRGLVINDN